MIGNNDAIKQGRQVRKHFKPSASLSSRNVEGIVAKLKHGAYSEKWFFGILAIAV
jgi:hypothetical protein